MENSKYPWELFVEVKIGGKIKKVRIIKSSIKYCIFIK